MKVYLLTVLICLAFLSCGYSDGYDDDPEIVYKKKKEDPEPKPNIEVSWDDLKGVIQSKCLTCHASQAPKLFPKDKFDAVMDRAKSAVSSGRMPPSGPLSDQEKQLFEGYKG